MQNCTVEMHSSNNVFSGTLVGMYVIQDQTHSYRQLGYDCQFMNCVLPKLIFLYCNFSAQLDLGGAEKYLKVVEIHYFILQNIMCKNFILNAIILWWIGLICSRFFVIGICTEPARSAEVSSSACFDLVCPHFFCSSLIH